MKIVRKRAATDARQEVADGALVGPYDGDGVSIPPGFSIYIGEWRCGWWKTREEACEVWAMISAAIAEGPHWRQGGGK